MQKNDESCLFCYLLLDKQEVDFHEKCSMKIFGQRAAPELPYSEDKLKELAAQIIKSQSSITGVQAKLSLHLNSGAQKKNTKRFTIVGLWGAYILKPATAQYPQLPEVEDLTLHLAEIAKIKVVPHRLIRMQSGNFAYITKRIDRIKKERLHMEDMCQLTERMSEDKYYGSYEQIAKIIQNISSIQVWIPLIFLSLFCFLFLPGIRICI